MSHAPLIIGHRGASAIAPENTLLAFTKAMELGADGVEFDVRLTRDGVPVVIHDRTLDRTGMMKGVVEELNSKELGEVDVGSWFRRKSPEAREFEKEKLPTLQQVFNLIKRFEGVFYLEMKGESGNADLASQVVAAIQTNNLFEKVIVSSFDLSLVADTKNIESRIRASALFEPNRARPLDMLKGSRLVELARDCGADEIALHHTLARPRAVEAAHKSSLAVVVWTVNSPRWVERASSLGVKALITNDPARMLSARNKRR